MLQWEMETQWAVLRRGVVCAAARPRTGMCPTLSTLSAQAARHVWLRHGLFVRAPSSPCVALASPCPRTCVASGPPSPLGFLRAHVKSGSRGPATAQHSTEQNRTELGGALTDWSL
jgi:hypothetical protein